MVKQCKPLRGSQSIFFKFSRVSSGDQLLAKEPEYSRYEINTSCATRNNKGYTDSDSIPAKKDKKEKIKITYFNVTCKYHQVK